MSTAEAIAFETVADLLDQLGVPAERVLLRPPPGEATERDLLLQKRRCELIDGVLVEKAMGWFESRLAATLIYFIERYLSGNPIGMVLGESAPIRLDLGQIRMPDVCFIPWERIDQGAPKGQILDAAPDLAIEVLSPSNTRKETSRKRADYFDAGCRLVWQADPATRVVEVFASPDQSTCFDENQTPYGDPVLPGFRLSVKEWFDRASGAQGASSHSS
ncbi:MAG: Uma2 family endonuclease [Gemmataceae bacterium]|nr:Uma2 family endonuclease [Gemmataceae bacterium]